MKDNNKYSYTYSSTSSESERREVERIRSHYQNTEKNQDFLRLKKLDKRVRRYPFIISLVLVIIGVLIFGFGLTLVLQWNEFIWGIIVMLIGCIPMAFSRPLHEILYKKNNAKYRDEILELSERLLEEKKDTE